MEFKKLLVAATMASIITTSFTGAFAQPNIENYQEYDYYESDIRYDLSYDAELFENFGDDLYGYNENILEGAKQNEVDIPPEPEHDGDGDIYYADPPGGESVPDSATDNTMGEETQSNEDIMKDDMISSFTINFSAVLNGWPRDEYAVFNIYSDDDALLDSRTRYINTTDSFTIEFSVPESTVGTVFYLEVTGVDSIDYYSENYPLPLSEKIPLYTYWSETDEAGIRTPVSTAYITIHQRTQCPINIYVDGKYISLSSPAIFDGSYIIAPLSEVAEAIGISDCTYYPEYNSVKVKTGDNEMLVNIGFSYVTVFGQDRYLNHPVRNINSLTYIELRPFIEAFGCTLNYADAGTYVDINLDKSPIAIESITALESRINQSGLGSSTDYLIWINKQKFRCTVFKGEKGNWKWVKDFTVGIGASRSETITGVYEYCARDERWSYSSYYVGPALIFYGNYAIHSTLLKYDGTPYDNTVGAKISLGCVRCQPQYINWLDANIPMKTRVYVTEN